MPPITPRKPLQRTIEHREIFHDEMGRLMRQVIARVSPVYGRPIPHRTGGEEGNHRPRSPRRRK